MIQKITLVEIVKKEMRIATELVRDTKSLRQIDQELQEISITQGGECMYGLPVPHDSANESFYCRSFFFNAVCVDILSEI